MAVAPLLAHDRDGMFISACPYDSPFGLGRGEDAPAEVPRRPNPRIPELELSPLSKLPQDFAGERIRS